MKRVLVVAAVLLVLLAALFLWQPRQPTIAPEFINPAAQVASESPGEVVRGAAESEDDVPVNSEMNCPDYSGPADQRLDSGEVSDRLHDAASVLRNSSDPEHRLAAGLILSNDTPEDAFELMRGTATTHPTSAIATWRLLILCGQRDVAACESESIEESAIRADGDNGMMWVQLASRRLDSGREQEAADAIRHAIAAPRFDTYFTDQIELLDRSLASVLDWSFAERVVHSSGSVYVSPANFGFIRSHCENVSSGIWPELCDQLGQRMISGNVDLQTKSLGSVLRVAVLEKIGDVDGAEAARTERDELNSKQDLLGADDSLLNLILSDDTVLRDYLSVSQSYGEVEALRRLEEQAARLRATPGYDQCNFVTNPYIRL